MNHQVHGLARIYDRLMSTIPYGQWVDYTFGVAHDFGHPIHRVLDIGCGTGTATLMFADRGCRIVGVDISKEMIREARRKSVGRILVRYEASAMQDIALPERFDTAVSYFDSLNYIIEPEDLQEGIQRVYEHLDPGGMFMFDMNTPYALEQELFTQSHFDPNDPVNYAWKSTYNAETRLTQVDMAFYVKRGDARRTILAQHFQRAYRMNEVRDMLASAGFQVMGMYEAYTQRKPTKRTDRVFFAARKPWEVLS